MEIFLEKGTECFHRITEYPELEETHKETEFNSWVCSTGPPKNQTIYLRALSKPFLNSNRLRAMATSLGSLSQCPTTVSVKNLFLISNLNLP